jgi:hypothetical protein
MNPDNTEYELTPTDPQYKPKKVLTNLNDRRIIRPVNNITRKDESMSNQETEKPKKNKRNFKIEAIKSIAWLLESGFRGFVGWILLSNFDRLPTTIAAFYALGTAAIIVITHFIKAHK